MIEALDLLLTWIIAGNLVYCFLSFTEKSIPKWMVYILRLVYGPVVWSFYLISWIETKHHI